MSCEGSISCKYPIVNKKYRLCKKHNWERMNPGKDFYQEANRKQQDTKNKMVEKQLAKPKKIVKKKKIKHRTTKRLKEEREYYEKNRPEHLSENPFCKVCLDKGIKTEATTIHHIRGRIGKLLNNKIYFLSTCMPCHDKIENKPLWAKDKKYSESRLTN